MTDVTEASPPGAGKPPLTGRTSVPDSAIADLLIGLRRQRLCILLSWRDTILPLRRAFLGPSWITLQATLWVLLIVLVFRRALGEDNADYPLYVAAGVVSFQCVTIMLTDGANAFLRESGLIRNVPNPFSIYVYRVFWKGVFAYAFQIPVLIGGAIWAQAAIGPAAIALHLLGVAILLVSLLGAAFALASAAAAVKDLVPLMQAVMRFLFFASPVFWYAADRGGLRLVFVEYNPIAHYLALVRNPLIGEPFLAELGVCLMLAGAFWAVGLGLFAVARTRLALWI